VLIAGLLVIVFAGSGEEYSAFAAPKRFELAHYSPDDWVTKQQKYAVKQTTRQAQNYWMQRSRKYQRRD
jgi:hypothetical protein